MSDQDLADATGLGRSRIQTYTSGRTMMDVLVMEQLGRALGIEPGVFFMESDRAIRWVLDHDPGAPRDTETNLQRRRRERREQEQRGNEQYPAVALLEAA
jgi:transcriptional regulator with XRE-family HTH domain